MAINLDVIGSVIGAVGGYIRGWTFRLGFATPPTNEEVARQIEQFVESMLPSTSPRLQKFLQQEASNLTFTLLGVWRDT